MEGEASIAFNNLQKLRNPGLKRHAKCSEREKGGKSYTCEQESELLNHNSGNTAALGGPAKPGEPPSLGGNATLDSDSVSG